MASASSWHSPAGYACYRRVRNLSLTVPVSGMYGCVVKEQTPPALSQLGVQGVSVHVEGTHMRVRSEPCFDSTVVYDVVVAVTALNLLSS